MYKCWSSFNKYTFFSGMVFLNYFGWNCFTLYINTEILTGQVGKNSANLYNLMTGLFICERWGLDSSPCSKKYLVYTK